MRSAIDSGEEGGIDLMEENEINDSSETIPRRRARRGSFVVGIVRLQTRCGIINGLRGPSILVTSRYRFLVPDVPPYVTAMRYNF